MRNFGKRGFALFLALMLCLSLFPSALAEDAGRIAAAEDAPEQEGTIAPAEEGSIRPAEEGDALPRTDETQDGETSGQCGENLNWSLDHYGRLTISGTGDMWNWSSLESGWPSAPWQATVSHISSIFIEPGVTSIGDYAFYGCQNMTEITISDTVTRIGASAFSSCNIIPSMMIPEGVTSIGAAAFASCHGLKSIWLPASLSQVGGALLSSCSGLTEVCFGGTMEDWKRLGAAYDHSQVTVRCADGDINPTDPTLCGDALTWSLSDGVLTITGSGDMWNFGYGQTPWWSRNSEIKELRLTRGVTSIGNYAFQSCRSLNSVTIPEGITRIGDYAFQNCTSLSLLTLPKTLRSIGDYAFYYCTQLSRVTIPEGLAWIGDDAFGFCTSLYVLTLPKTVTHIGASAFINSYICSFVIPEGVTSIKDNTFYYCSQLTSVIIPETVNEIGKDAFYGCCGLTSIEIPKTVHYIGARAFWDCSGLTSVVISGGVPVIGERVFAYCSSLTNVIIGEGCECIDSTAFWSCKNLRSLSLPGSMTSLNCSLSSFSELHDVYFGGTLEAWKALQVIYDRMSVAVHCTDGNIMSVPAEQCGNELTWSIDDETGTLTITGSGNMWDWFYNAPAPWSSVQVSIKSIVLPRGLTSIGSWAFYSCKRLTSLDIPAGVTSIGAHAFNSCTGLTSVTMPEGVISIGAHAFYSCTGLTSVTVPVSASEIDTSIFRNCQNLKDIYYAGTCEAWREFNLVYDHASVTVYCADGTIKPNSDTNRCGENLFWSLESGILTITGSGDMWNYDDFSSTPWYSQRDVITEIRLAEGVTGIGNYAFSTYIPFSSILYCANLSSVKLPETLQRIGTCGLAGCNALKKIRLPDSLKEIGEYGFAGCGFTELTLPEGLETIGSEAFRGVMIQRLIIPACVTEIGTNAFLFSSLNEIHFLGDAPAIDEAALYGITSTAYYPQNNPTWTQAVLKSYGGIVTWVPYLATGATISIGYATACAGRGFTVDLSLDKNPGVMALSFQLAYDASMMEFVGAEDGIFTGWTVNAKKNALVWDDDSEHMETGCLLKLKFRLKQDAAPGKTNIGIENLCVVNLNEDKLLFQIKPGSVNVLFHRPGDANGDGNVDIGDLVRLRKYLVCVEKEIVADNADVNADDVVDILDLIRLRKYIALEDVILE